MKRVDPSILLSPFGCGSAAPLHNSRASHQIILLRDVNAALLGPAKVALRATSKCLATRS